MRDIAPAFALKREQARLKLKALEEKQRFFDSAQRGTRRIGDWFAPSTSSNQESLYAIQTLRDRARDLVRNNPWARRIADQLVSGIISSGITPEFSHPNQKILSKVKSKWSQFALNPEAFDREGRLDFLAAQRLLIESVIVSGEALVRIYTGTPQSPFQFQLLEPDFLDHNRQQEGADTFIVSGVELCKNTGRRVAYWLHNEHPGGLVTSAGYNSAISQPVDAKEVLHIYKPDRIGALRGVSHLSPVILLLKDSADYLSVQLLRQKLSSCFVATVTDDLQESGFLDDQNSLSFDKLEPGSVLKLQPGQQMHFSNPPQIDGASFSAYYRTLLGAIASGVSLSYESLTGDFSESSFSSARLGSLAMEQNFRALRNQVLIPQFCLPIMEKFLLSCDLDGLPTREISFRWSEPRREYLDPQAETSSTIEQINAGLQSLSGAIRARGESPEKIFNEIEAEQTLTFLKERKKEREAVNG